MKVKNLVLFGFVVSALSYLNDEAKKDREEGNETLTGLEDVDLDEVRKEMGLKLQEAVGEFGEVVSSIVNIGQEAFENYITENGDDEIVSLEELENLLKDDEIENEVVSETKTDANDDSNYLDNWENYLDSFFDDTLESQKELADILEKVETKEKAKEDTKQADDYLEEIEKAVNSSNQEDLMDVEDLFADLYQSERTDEATAKEIDDLFSEILEGEKAEEVKQEIQNKEDEVHDLVNDLEDYLNETTLENKEVEKSEKPEEIIENMNNDNEYSEIYRRINELYPYLSLGFIQNVFDLKETIAEEYPLNKKVIVLHRVRFKDLEHLHQFVELASNNGYNVNVDENQMIVDIFRCYVNTDGRILTNIFEIANRARLLDGYYEGYRIDVEKEEA